MNSIIGAITALEWSWSNLLLMRIFRRRTLTSANSLASAKILATAEAPPADDGISISLSTLLNEKYRVVAQAKNKTTRQSSGRHGQQISPVIGAGIEFEEIVPYCPGDDLRHIDWRAAAKTGALYTRRYKEESEQSVLIVCDQRVSMFFGSNIAFKSYRAALHAATCGWLANLQGHRVGGLVLSSTLEHVPMGHAGRTMLTLSDALARHNQALNVDSDDAMPLSTLLEVIVSMVGAGMSVVIISDFSDLDDTACDTLMLIARKSQLHLQVVVDPLETILPAVGRVGVSNGIDSTRVSVGPSVTRAYRHKCLANHQKLSDLALRWGASLGFDGGIDNGIDIDNGIGHQ